MLVVSSIEVLRARNLGLKHFSGKNMRCENSLKRAFQARRTGFEIARSKCWQQRVKPKARILIS